jgi:hypothetical protein
VAKAQLIPGDGLFHRKLRVADADVVWLRSILEAYEGLAALHGDGSGVVTLTTTLSQAGDLDALIDELAAEARLQRL